MSLLPMACAKQATCDNAFDHMQQVSRKEMDSLAPADKEMAQKIAAEAAKKDAQRRTRFVEKCNAGKVDAACIMKAEDTLGYVACFVAKATPPS